MTKQAAEKRDVAAEYKAATAPADGKFQHFATEKEKQEHLEHVEKNKDSTPF